MRPEHRSFRISPVTVPADRQSTVTVSPLFGHCVFDPAAAYRVLTFPCEEACPRSGWRRGAEAGCVLVDGSLAITQVFEGEQEHVLLIERTSDESPVQVAEVRVYSLQPDLAALRPFKGDLHMHTHHSDGRESPAYVAAACRRIGLDFIAVTDHRRYEPSLEAINTFSNVDIDLRIYPGEEVHPPGNPLHIVNFGGSISINALFADEQAYGEAVRAVDERLGVLPDGLSRYEAASAVWCFERIREAGGLGIFCHPYWFTDHRYAPSGALTSYLFETQPYDAFELIGGYHLFEVESNTLQVARYHEERARGREIAIVGSTDSHGVERGALFGWYCTIVFAPSTDLVDLIGAVKGLWSVAVEALPGQVPRAYGPFRLVKYALFLMREVFPIRDELCVEEGRLMAAHAAGDPDAAAGLAARAGSVGRTMDRLLGAKP